MKIEMIPLPEDGDNNCEVCGNKIELCRECIEWGNALCKINIPRSEIEGLIEKKSFYPAYENRYIFPKVKVIKVQDIESILKGGG